ncbi:MAG: chemotaxis protein CheW [Thermodesulfovibrionales bacterium]|jgi:purine-binding chemotaxis protein CheW
MTDEKASHPEASVDWNEVRKRLKRVQAVIEQSWAPDPEEEKKILRARARALAKEPRKKTVGEEIEIVEFLLAYEKYGVDTSYVREVYPLNDLTPVPCTPPFLLGVINVRGQVLSVIDIKKFFDLPEKGLGDLNKVIIVRSDAMEFGILADAVLGVSGVFVNELQPSLPTLTGIRKEYLRGITKDRTVILDAEKLLSDRNLVVHEEI